MIAIVKSESKFQELESNWNELYQTTQNRTPFQTFSFNWSSWENILKENSKNELWIYTQFSNKKLQVVCPLYIDQSGILRFINDLHVDFGDGLFSSHVQMFSSIRNIVQEVYKDTRVRGVRLSNLTDSSKIFPYIKSSLKESFTFSTTEHSFLPEILEDEIEKSSHLRSKERNSLQKASMDKEILHVMYELDNHEFPMTAVLEMKEKMITQGLRNSNFLDSGMINLIRELYKNRLVKINISKKNNSIIALNTIIIDTDRKWQMFWISLYSNEVSQSNIGAYNFCINSVLPNKDVTVDFGRGGYDYKFKNYLPTVKNVYELVWAKKSQHLLSVVFRINWFFVKKILKAKLKRK